MQRQSTADLGDQRNSARCGPTHWWGACRPLNRVGNGRGCGPCPGSARADVEFGDPVDDRLDCFVSVGLENEAMTVTGDSVLLEGYPRRVGTHGVEKIHRRRREIAECRGTSGEQRYRLARERCNLQVGDIGLTNLSWS